MQGVEDVEEKFQARFLWSTQPSIQRQFSTGGDLLLPVSNSSILSFL
jgi:hypothetical protein